MNNQATIMRNLKQLRLVIEEYKQIDMESACWWYDVLLAIGFNEAEIQRIMGFSYFLVTEFGAVEEGK